MDTLHQMAHTKISQTPSPVCGMSGYEFHNPNPEPNGISLMAGSEEMLRCSKEGFWVRGQKVAQDDREAETVYNAFKAWMSWAHLNKDYK